MLRIRRPQREVSEAAPSGLQIDVAPKIRRQTSAGDTVRIAVIQEQARPAALLPLIDASGHHGADILGAIPTLSHPPPVTAEVVDAVLEWATAPTAKRSEHGS